MQKERVAEAFRNYVDNVLRASFHLTKSRTEAEDCTQEAFFRLLAQPDSMQDSHIKPWLLRTVINLSKNYLRSARHRRTVSVSEVEQLAVITSLIPEEERAFGAVMKLPEIYRVPLYLHFVEGYSVAETADILKMNVNTVNSRIRRARQKLAKQLDPPMILHRKDEIDYDSTETG